MFNKSVEKTLATLLFIGVPITTLVLFISKVTDPVNVTKLAAAGTLGGAVFAIALIYGFKELWRNAKFLLLAILLFVIAMLNTVLSSSAPTSQNLYGVFGRQTGFIAYLVLAMIAIAAALLRRKISFEYLVWALIISGLANVIYCGWVILFGDFLGWTNPYKYILGFFGNPDFISAFLGMFIAGSVAYIVGKMKEQPLLGLLVPFQAFALYEIVQSHAIQGLVVTGAGLAFVGFYVVRTLLKHWAFSLSYVIGVAVLGAFAIAGTLQKGPLTQYVYKRSVSLRGTYWETGINMGQQHPWTGVGMDSYGNWYRALRPDRAITDMPGVKVITNAAHNVVIDFFAYGGYPLLLSYLAIIAIGIIAIIRVTFRSQEYDPIFVALATTWITYELQSIISINQVGLAIWGWVLAGALVAYEYTTRPAAEDVAKSKGKREKELIFSPQLLGGVGAVVGLLVAIPPMSADIAWKSAIGSKDIAKVEAALTPKYLTPNDSYRLAQAVILFENSKMPDQAYKYAQQGVKFNPDYFDAWRVLYSCSKATQADRDLALKNMKRLDPKNPDVLAQ